MIRKYGINHTLLEGSAQPSGFALNPHSDKTFLPNGEMYVTGIGFFDRLGLEARQYAPKLVEVANLVLPADNRRLLLPVR